MNGPPRADGSDVQSTVDDTRPSRSTSLGPTAWMPVVAGLVAFGLAALTLGSQDLALDEAYSVTSTNQLWTSLRQRSGSMALYYILLTPWSQISVDPAWIRLPSALFAGLAVAFTVRLAIRYFGLGVAAWTAAFMVPMWVVSRFGQEARSYSLVMLLAVVSWSLFLRVVGRRSAPAWWILWGLCGGALVYSHPLAGFVVASQLVVLWMEHPDRRAALVAAWPGLTVFAVLLVPMALTFGDESGATPDWIPPLGGHSFVEMATILGGPWPGARLLLTVALVVATVSVLRSTSTRTGSGAPPVDDARWLTVCLVSWAWVTPVGILVISIAEPMVRERYLSGAVPAAALVMALAVSRLDAARQIAAGGAIVLLLVPGQIQVHTASGHPWREAVVLVESDLSADEAHGVLFIATGSRHPFELAARGTDVLTETVPVRPAEAWGTDLRYFEDTGLDDLQPRTAELNVLWLVEQRVPLGRTQAAPPHWSQAEPLEAVGWCVDVRHQLHDELEVIRFDRCDTP